MSRDSEGLGTASHRVVLVQCTGQKRDGTHPARDLYDESDYFVKQRMYARAVADQWFIQSAKHGLVDPDEEISYYDEHAKDIDDAEAWGADIAAGLDNRVPSESVIEILGGRAYADPLVPELEVKGYEVLEPLRGEKIGRRKMRLSQMANTTLEGYA